MTHWIYDTQAQAEQAQQLINQLGARALNLHLGYARDANGFALGRDEAGTIGTVPTSNWSVPRETVDGKWAIVTPETHPLWNTALDEIPATLAIAGGEDPNNVDWASFGVSDPDVEITLPGSQWMLFVLSFYGLSPVQGTPQLIDIGNDQVTP